MSESFKILLISSDKFFRGLLEGYCHAHHHVLCVINSSEQLSPRTFDARLDLIIQDMRSVMKESRGEEMHLQFLKKITVRHKIPVCVIGDRHSVQQFESEEKAWVDECFIEPFNIEKIDDYFRNKFYFHYQILKEERRRNERRRIERRAFNSDYEPDPSGSYEKFNVNNHSDCYQVGPFTVDNRIKSVSLYDINLELTSKEFKLFQLLASNTERVFVPEEIIKHLWPENNRAAKSDLYQYMHLLRKKIEQDLYNPQWIVTIKGFGYRLNVPASQDVMHGPKENQNLSDRAANRNT